MNSRIFFIGLCLAVAFFASAHHGDKSNKENKPASKEICEKISQLTAECSKTPTSIFHNNRLWTVFVNDGHIKLAYSDDLGATYGQSVIVNQEPEKINSDGENRPKIALGNDDEIYLSWVKKTEGRYTGDIRFSRSLDNGKTFSKPITINDDGLLTSHRYASLIVTPDGHVYISWLDKRDLLEAKKQDRPYSGSALYYSVSRDSGKTFSNNRKITDHSCECCRVITAIDSTGTPIVLWRHVFGDHIRDHAIARLDENFVNNPGKITRVTFDNWKIEACPHHGPDMALDNQDNVHLTWFTGREGKGGLHYARYDKADANLKNPFYIDNSPTASRPQISIHGDVITILWKRVVDKQTLLKYVISQDSGKTWSSEKTLLTSQSDSDYPQLLRSQQQLFAAWWSKDYGYRVISMDSDPNSELKAFHDGSFEFIKDKYAKQDYLFVLWSLDCPPCFKEMELLSSYHKTNKLPNLVLIATNGEDDREALQEILNKFEITDADNWYFDGITENLRYQIDPSWYGELPRSYFFNKQGEHYAHKGLLKEDTLKKWLESLAQK